MTKEKQFDEIETWYKAHRKSKHNLGGGAGGGAAGVVGSSPSVY